MSFIRNRLNLRLLLVATSCLAIGAGASAIATAGASTGNASGASNHAAHARHARHRLFSRAVHGDLVVHTKAGFVTVTLDRGVVQSVSGQQLTLAEGTKKATYKTLTLSIPASARVRVNRQKATLADVKPGQRVVVLQGLKRTQVIARTPKAA